MDDAADLKLLISSRYPLIFAEATEEERVLEVLDRAAAPTPVWVWSAARGLAIRGGQPQYGTTDPSKALDFCADLGPAVVVFADANVQLQQPVFVRRLKEIAQSPTPGRTYVFASARSEVPLELQGLAVAWKQKPPSKQELVGIVRATLDDLASQNVAVHVSSEQIDTLADGVRGLSTIEARRLVEEAGVRDGAVSADDVGFIERKKAEMLQQAGSLEVVDTGDLSLDEVGGLERLKDWLRTRGRAFEPAARTFGLDAPRGVLVTGVPGCGKSLIAKALASAWRMPLAALDTGSLYGAYVGQSEERLRAALDAAEAMAPVVVWIDEIEKAFASGGTGDGGVSERVLGAFLRWMQERPDGVFVVATSNDVSVLPPELLRKGRFDDIFFVDLPDGDERRSIVRIQLARRGRKPEDFDLDAIVAASDGFSGAEIEAGIVSALYRAYAAGTSLSTADIVTEMHATVPLSKTRAEDIARIRAWAQTRAVPASEPADTSGLRAIR